MLMINKIEPCRLQMKRRNFYQITLFAFILFVLSIFNSCKENSENFTLGIQFIESQTSINLIDTFSVSLSTVILDTVSTSGTGSLLVGNYSDATFGKINSNSYFQIGVPDGFDVENNDIYDSLNLVIKYSGYSFGDTTKGQKISVHQLTENIKLNDNDLLTSKDVFNYNQEPMGTIIYTPLPNGSTDSLVIKLSDYIGSDLFTKMQENSEVLTDDESFRNYFHGLALVTDDSYEGSIIGFNVSDTKLILYTSRESSVSTEEINYTFSLKDSAKQFNNIEHNFSSSQLNKLSQQRDKLSSSETNGLSFLQGGIGLAIRVDVPALQDVLLYNRGLIVKAELSISPSVGSYNYFKLPDYLYVYASDKLNRTNTAIASSSLTTDNLYNEETEYTFDITTYLNYDLSDSYIDPENGFLITLPPDELTTTFYRLIADSNSKNTRLKIYYLSY